MCQIFIRADPELYVMRSRSLRLRGVATSIRLENQFWDVLEEIGERDGLTLPRLISKLYDELAEAGGGDGAHLLARDRNLRRRGSARLGGTSIPRVGAPPHARPRGGSSACRHAPLRSP